MMRIDEAMILPPKQKMRDVVGLFVWWCHVKGTQTGQQLGYIPAVTRFFVAEYIKHRLKLKMVPQTHVVEVPFVAHVTQAKAPVEQNTLIEPSTLFRCEFLTRSAVLCQRLERSRTARKGFDGIPPALQTRPVDKH